MKVLLIDQEGNNWTFDNSFVPREGDQVVLQHGGCHVPYKVTKVRLDLYKQEAIATITWNL